MRGLAADLRAALRAHARAGATSFVALAILALGIAATSLAFSLLNAFFLRPPQVREPAALVRIYAGSTSGLRHFTMGYDDVRELREAAAALAFAGSAFAGIAGEAPLPLSFGARGGTERLWGELVSSDYFALLGARPALGRLLVSGLDDAAGSEAAVVLSHGLWQRRFAASRSVIGEPVFVNGRPGRVVGVAAGGFHGVTGGLRPELWLPAEREAELVRAGGARGYFAVGRLAPGASLAEARAALELVGARLERDAAGTRREFEALPEAAGRIHPSARSAFLGFSATLLATGGLLLMLACGNVAGLLLVRHSARRREIGTRMAAGATRARIARQLFAEAVVLALAASALGVTLAGWGARLLSAARLPVDWPLGFDFGLDARVVAASLVATLATALGAGLAPALEASRTDVLRLLRDSPSGPPPRAQAGLVGLQVALSTLLLVGGGLFLRSLGEARGADVGFDPARLVLVSADPGLEGASAAEARVYWERVKRTLSSLPGVEALSLASTVPLELDVTETDLAPEGYAPPPDGSWPAVAFAVVDAGYFAAMRGPLAAGREFEARDLDPRAPGLVIVDEALARRHWPDGNPVGRWMTDRAGSRFEVIGVARTAPRLAIGEPARGQVYFPHRPDVARAMTVVVRGSGEARRLLAEVEARVRAADERVAVYNAKTAAAHVNAALAAQRAAAAALNGVGLVALLLAAVGLHATLAFLVARRGHEIGVRRALGASGLDVAWLVCRRLVSPVGLGLAAGTAGGLAAGRSLEGLLHGVRGADPVVLTLAPLAVLAAAVLAGIAPARRAVRLDPARSLRCE